MNDDHLLNYLRSGQWGGFQSRVDRPIILGHKTFPSQYAARQYVKNLMASTSEGKEIVGDDAEMLTELVRWSKHYKHIEKHGILGFTTKDHPRAGNKTELVKILVVILASVTGRYPRTRLAECDVSIRDCFDNMEANRETKRAVFRQDEAA